MPDQTDIPPSQVTLHPQQSLGKWAAFAPAGYTSPTVDTQPAGDDPAAYAAAVSRNQAMVDHAVANAPSPQLASVAHQLGTTSSPAVKQQVIDAVMKKASPSERSYLTTYVKPLVNYGK
jgi:hypothetical protein